MLALVAGLGAGCGSDDEQEGEPIPPDAAAALQRQLDSIEARYEFGGDACADITGNEDPNTTAVESAIDGLPEDVDPDVRDALQESFDHLFELTEEQCDEDKGQETDTEPEPQPETEAKTEPTPTVTEPDTTAEEPPPPEQPPEEAPPGQTEELPPGQGGDNPGQGVGGGVLSPGNEQ